jgi:hypothetical protein
MLDSADVKAQLVRLAKLDPGDAWRWKTSPTWSAARLAAFETKHFKLPVDYRGWLRDVGDGGLGFIKGGMRKLSSQSKAELARAAKRFRIAGDSTPSPRRFVGGLLQIGSDPQLCPIYLVTNGKRAGEVWIDGFGWGDSVLHRAGTFAEMSREWLASVVRAAEAGMVPRVPASLEAVAPAERFSQLCRSFVPWLRQGTALFADAIEHVEVPNRPDVIKRGIVDAIDREPRWLEDPELAVRAADALSAVLKRAEEPVDALDRALDAMYDADPPDLAPARVREWLDAMATRRGQRDDRISRWSGQWLQHELVRGRRVEEAIEVWKHRVHVDGQDWVDFARSLIAIGRTDAIQLADQRAVGSRQHWGIDDTDRNRAWMHFELGNRELALEHLERHVALCSYCAPELEMMRSKRRIELPPYLGTRDEMLAPYARRHTRHHELVALLYGIAGDGEHMADAAVHVLSRPASIREPQEHANHRAHLRMGRALSGRHDGDREHIEARYGDLQGLRGRLAKAILDRTGDLGIHVQR